jgi:hypothetical protein
MADLSDVEDALVLEVTGALYPEGVTQVSVVGTTCRIYRGWPLTASLNSDLATGVVNVTVFPTSKRDEVPDPYLDQPYATSSPASLIASVTGQSVTFSGLVESNQVVGLLVDGIPFSYPVGVSDTTDSIAANLAAPIGATRAVAISGSTVTIPGVITLIGRVVANGSVSEQLRRQRREIQVSCWCPTAALRDTVCQAVDLALTSTPFQALTDGTKAHIHYVSTQVYDQSQNALLFRRDLCYLCEYTIISESVAPAMLFGDLDRNGNSSFN